MSKWSLDQLRAHIKDKDWDIKTSGAGRTKEAIVTDMKARTDAAFKTPMKQEDNKVLVTPSGVKLTADMEPRASYELQNWTAWHVPVPTR